MGYKSKKRVSFWATKKVKKPVKVSFIRSTGEKVSFKATRTVKRPIKVTFYRKKYRKK